MPIQVIFAIVQLMTQAVQFLLSPEGQADVAEVRRVVGVVVEQLQALAAMLSKPTASDADYAAITAQIAVARTRLAHAPGGTQP